MGGLIIEAAAVLNEDNPEFFDKLMKMESMQLNQK